MREIGGFFELERFRGQERFNNTAFAVNSARNALLCLIHARKIRKLYIPRYLCGSIRKLLIREAILFEEYHIQENFLPVEDVVEAAEDVYLLLVNYYGLLTDEDIRKVQIQYKNVIVDQTHAFYREPIPDVDMIYNCRKYFGVPDGAYIIWNKYKNPDRTFIDQIAGDSSMTRMEHLLGRLEYTAEEYYESFQKAEEVFEMLPLRAMSVLTHTLLRAVNYDSVRNIRTDNYRELHKGLGAINQLKVPESIEGAFAYPLMVQNAANVRKMLIAEKIFIPVLWPDVLERVGKGSVEQRYVESIMPIPCDQRYNISDMQYLMERIYHAAGLTDHDERCPGWLEGRKKCEKKF